MVDQSPISGIARIGMMHPYHRDLEGGGRPCAGHPQEGSDILPSRSEASPSSVRARISPRTRCESGSG